VTSRTNQDRTSEALARIPTLETLTAIFVSQTGALAKVNQGNRTIDVRSVSRYPLIPGESVRLEYRDSALVVTGPTLPRAATGKVVGTGSPQCTVEYPDGSGVTKQMPYPSTYTPTLNDIVSINWETSGSIEAKLTALPAVTVPGTKAPEGVVEYHPSPFPAIDAGSYRLGSWWTQDVIASDNNSGCWFYNIKDTIPDSATITSARIYLPLRSAPGSESPQLGRHSLTSKSGAPSVTAAAALEPRSGWVSIPTSLIDYLKANDGGLGFVAGYSYTIWNGVNIDGLSGALDITYTA
jgi:hypothetical protein